MFVRMKDIPEPLGNINGVEYTAEIPVKINTNETIRIDIMNALEGKDGYDKVDTITLDKQYSIKKIIAYGDCYDVVITNDLGFDEEFGEWFFEDVEE